MATTPCTSGPLLCLLEQRLRPVRYVFRKSHYRGQPPRRRQDARDAFDTNQALLSLNVLAHNLLNLGRRIVERAQSRRGRPTLFGRSSPAMSLHTF